MTPEQFQEWIGELVPFFMELAIFSGFAGAAFVWFLWELFGLVFWLLEKHALKRRALAWKKRQDMAKAAQGAQPRGDDVAGRACETRSGGAA